MPSRLHVEAFVDRTTSPVETPTPDFWIVCRDIVVNEAILSVNADWLSHRWDYVRCLFDTGMEESTIRQLNVSSWFFSFH